MRVIANAFAVVSGVTLGRLLGTEGYGCYTFVMAWVGLLVVPANLGLPPLITRGISAFVPREQWVQAAALLRHGMALAAASSIGIAILASAYVHFFGADLADHRRVALYWAFAMLPIMSLSAIRAASLSGLQHPVLAQVPELVIRPFVFLILISLAALVFGRFSVGPQVALAMQVAAAFVAFLAGSRWLLLRLPRSLRNVRPHGYPASWISGASWFLASEVFWAINASAPVLALGVNASEHEVGILRASVVAAGLITLPIVAAGSVVAPAIARLHAVGDLRRLQLLLTWAARSVFLVALPIGAVLWFAGGELLTVVFGPEFIGGATVVRILCLGQLGCAANGFAVNLLAMAGRERDLVASVSIGAAATLTTSLILTPQWGAEGAALAVLLGQVSWNLSMSCRSSKYLGIRTSVIGGRALDRSAGNSSPS